MERHMMYNPRQCIVVQRRNYDADLYKKQLWALRSVAQNRVQPTRRQLHPITQTVWTTVPVGGQAFWRLGSTSASHRLT
jgi:hypothetical protein